MSKDYSRGYGSQSDRSSSRRSVVEGQHVRFEEDDVAVGRKERDDTARSWRERSGERGYRYGGRNSDTLDGSRTAVRVEQEHTRRWKIVPESPPAASLDRSCDADEGEDAIERRDRHRRRAADALDGKREVVRGESTLRESWKTARELPTEGIARPKEKAEREGLETLRLSSRTAERSPISSSSKSKDSASSPRTSKPSRRVTVHQYRYGENV